MSQEQGNVSEIEFLARAIRKGLSVSRPMFVEKYDCLIDNGKDVLKVQIKSTTHWNKSSWQVSLRNGCTQKEKYKKGDCDFFAIHIIKLNVWYILPFEAVSPKVCLHPDLDSCRYDKYKEAWNLLHASTNERSTSEILKLEPQLELHP
jgi:hypothetical protein